MGVVSNFKSRCAGSNTGVAFNPRFINVHANRRVYFDLHMTSASAISRACNSGWFARKYVLWCPYASLLRGSRRLDGVDRPACVSLWDRVCVGGTDGLRAGETEDAGIAGLGRGSGPGARLLVGRRRRHRPPAGARACHCLEPSCTIQTAFVLFCKNTGDGFAPRKLDVSAVIGSIRYGTASPCLEVTRQPTWPVTRRSAEEEIL